MIGVSNPVSSPIHPINLSTSIFATCEKISYIGGAWAKASLMKA